jgi:hypothetical protein
MFLHTIFCDGQQKKDQFDTRRYKCWKVLVHHWEEVKAERVEEELSLTYTEPLQEPKTRKKRYPKNHLFMLVLLNIRRRKCRWWLQVNVLPLLLTPWPDVNRELLMRKTQEPLRWRSNQSTSLRVGRREKNKKQMQEEERVKKMMMLVVVMMMMALKHCLLLHPRQCWLRFYPFFTQTNLLSTNLSGVTVGVTR